MTIDVRPPAPAVKTPTVRLGPIQKKLLQWVTESGRVCIEPASVPPMHLGLGGYTMDEVGSALARLVQRGLLETTPKWLGETAIRRTAR